LSAAEKIRFVDVQYIDLTGFLRSVTISYQAYLDKIPSYIASFDGSSVEGFEEINKSDMFLKADEKTFSRVPWDTNKARVIGEIYDLKNKRYEKDPRYIAFSTTDYIKQQGYSPMVGSEIEFFLFDSIDLDVGNPIKGIGYDLTSQEQPWDFSGLTLRTKKSYHMAEPNDKLSKTRSEIINSFKEFGYDFEASHHEVAVSQNEISIKAGDPLLVGDEIVTLKYVARNISLQNGLTPVFMPKPLFGDNGSGLHFHMSLWDTNNKTNLFYDDSTNDISQLARYFIGGVLYHGRSLAALVAPTTNSYHRLVPGYEAPVYLVWGHSNRSAAVRIPSTGGKSKLTRIEFRSPDPTCNPYLALSASLLAGLDGIKKKIDPGDPYENNVYEMPGNLLKEKKIITLPKSLDEALEELESDNNYLKPIFNNELLESYLDIKRKECDTIRMMPNPYEIYMYLNL
jgi:glutamine synthetase